MAKAGTRFVLKRLHWTENYDDKLARGPGEVAVASFATFEEAEAERARREEEVRKKLNPFECGGAIQYWTHLDEPRLRDWLMDHGVEPPKAGKDGATNWAAWWKANQKKLSTDKRAAVWEALDKVRFFAVREEPARPVGYAVLGVNWEYNDENYSADPEGGRVMTVYRSRERAEQECERLNEEARDAWGWVDEQFAEFADDYDDFAMPAFDMTDRLRRKRELTGGPKLKRGEGEFKSTAGVPFYEIIEVELEGVE
jgi:hypothetical protein